MFIDTAGRAIEYIGQLDDTQVSVREWRNTETDTTTQWKQGTVLTPASQFDLGGAAGLHTLPVRDLGRLLRILYMVNGNKVVIEGVSRIVELPKNLSPTSPWIRTLQKIFNEHRMPKNTACFTDGSWTAATPTGNRFAQEPSSQDNVATAGQFYCADSLDWEHMWWQPNQGTLSLPN